jgi:hypothetical protein
MCHELLNRRSSVRVMVMVLTLGLTGPVLAVDHFWTGAVSTDAADPRNWDNGTTTPTLPSNDDIVRIGCTSAWVDYVPTNQPVLTSEWVSRAGDTSAGWWFVLGVGNQNTLTIGDGAYIEWSHNDCNLRNGGILRVIGRRTGGGPSLVIAPRFRLANNGDSIATATGTIIVEKNGYLRFDPGVSRKGSGGRDIYMGTAAKALIEIRDNGILELVPKADGTVIPRFNFGSADPAANKIVISGKGQLILTGDLATIAQVAGTDTSLQSLIDTGLITTANKDEKLVFSGVSPTVVKLAGQRVAHPKPADSELAVDRYVSLAWDPGTMTDTYDVYLGTDAAKVSEATRTNPSGALQSEGQAGARYPLEGMLTLEYGRTYYWRVDEAEVPPNREILKGKIWSFTVEPFAIPVPIQSITATASGSSPDQEPEKTIDGSGLDVNDCHSTVLTDMWLSDTTRPTWIQYTFDQVYSIRRMLVWNYNGEEILTVLGLKDVTVGYSADGVTWTPLAGVPSLEQAPGTPDYAAPAAVDFGDVAVKGVRITAQSNWGNSLIFNKYGLSEVRFLHVPVAARLPSPDSGATEVAVDPILGWRAGRKAAVHQVYLDTDQQAVASGTAAATTVAQASYSVSSLLLGTTYFWRVDEVNAAETVTTWVGPVWSFTTTDYLVLDDMEGYTDNEAAGEAIYQTWVDGYDTTTNGAQVGYGASTNGTFGETITVHDGKQSMPLTYTNSGKATNSEAVRTFDAVQDWTRSGIGSLTLFFYGQAANPMAVPFYVTLTDQNNKTARVVYGTAAGEDVANLAKMVWTQWSIPLTCFNGVTLSKIKSMTLGFGPGAGSGRIFVDDIRLQR